MDKGSTCESEVSVNSSWVLENEFFRLVVRFFFFLQDATALDTRPGIFPVTRLRRMGNARTNIFVMKTTKDMALRGELSMDSPAFVACWSRKSWTINMIPMKRVNTLARRAHIWKLDIFQRKAQYIRFIQFSCVSNMIVPKHDISEYNMPKIGCCMTSIQNLSHQCTQLPTLIFVNKQNLASWILHIDKIGWSPNTPKTTVLFLKAVEAVWAVWFEEQGEDQKDQGDH